MKKLSLLAVSGALMLLVGIAVFRGGGEDSAHAQSIAETGDANRTAEAERIRQEIQNDPVAPTIAPPGHDVTIVIFSDYQCPYCRKVHPVLDALLRDDKKVKLVYRDWPIFGPASIEAAKAAIASKYQGKHAAFNDALMQTQGKLTSASIRAAADRSGVDWAKLQSDLRTYEDEIAGALDRTGRHAAMIGLSGTPAMLVGSYLVPGAVDLPNLQNTVAMARQGE